MSIRGAIAGAGRTGMVARDREGASMRRYGAALGRRAALAGAGLLAACSPAGLLNATVSEDGLAVERDVAYGEGPRRRMDVYRPAGAASGLPLIVFLYGGSWRGGSKSLYPFVAAPLARRGAVVAVPDYRVYPEVVFPGFLEDCAAAVAFAAANAGRWGADAGRLLVLGHSAGAYNGAMLLLDPRWLGEAGAPRPVGGALLAGPYDFLPITDPDIVPVFPDPGPQTQPITYLDGRNPPLLLLAGADDTTVRPRNTVTLAERIRAAGGPVEARILPDLGHIGIILAFAPWFRGKGPVLDLVWEFMSRVDSDSGRTPA
jgi:acetyl esterase/lipase